MVRLRTRSFRLIFALMAVTVALLLAWSVLSRLDFPSSLKREAILNLYRLPVGIPVRLKAFVTYTDPLEKRFWIQDETGAIAINDDPSIYGVRGGEWIQLEGKTTRSLDALTGVTIVSLGDLRITSIRNGFELPAPAAASLKTLPENEKTGIRVQLSGVVHRITHDHFGRTELAFGDTGQEIPATLGVTPGATSRWLNAMVHVVGVAELVSGDYGRPKYRHIWIQNGDEVHLQESAPRSEPLYSIRTLYSDLGSRDGHRIRLRGRVAAHLGAESLLVTDKWAAIACKFDEPQTIKVGTPIEVAGFPTADGLGIDLLHSSISEIPEMHVAGERQNEGPPEVTTVGAIRSLDEKQARAALPVRVSGVITYSDPGWHQLFLQDSSGGIFVKYPGSSAPLARGQAVILTGITSAGEYAPVIVAPKFVILGKGRLPKPILVTGNNASSGVLDSQFVEVEGVVHSIKTGQDLQHVKFELHSPFGQVEVFTGPTFLGPQSLHSIEDASVRLQGVLGTLFNSNRQLVGYQLSITSIRDIKILTPPELNSFNKAPVPVSSLLRFSPHANSSRQFKVRGSVTMIGRGFLYLQDEGGGLQVLTDSEGLGLSDLVEVIGYLSPGGSYSPVLTDARVHVIGHGTGVAPRPLTAESALQGQFDSRLGTIEARLLSVADTPNGRTLVMRSGVLTFTAEFGGIDPGQLLPPLQEGSLLRLTGVCSVQVDPRSLYLLLSQEPLGFKLLIPSPRDIKVIEPPGWWSNSHALTVFGVLSTTVFAVLSWVVLLRRRVSRQVYALDQASEKAKAIRDLARAMREVTAKGDFAEQVSINGNDEIAQLGVQFNTMLQELHQHDLRKKDAEAKLKYQAVTDELTGLPNRRLLSDRLSQALAIAKRNRHVLALLYIDLDGFKLVNDSLGHTVGDLLLGQVADRLQSRIRRSDTLARLGGDEFTMVLTSLNEKSAAGVVARSLLDVLARPFVIENHEITISASIGISVFPDHGTEAGDLLQQADSAMYTAKRNGKNQMMYFTPEIGLSVRERLSLESQLRGAISRAEIMVHYQPEFDAVSNQLIRFEALARWTHPTLGSIPPSKFIPIAEESGLISSLGAYVMEHACAEAVKWQAISHRPIQIAVNVSSLQFARDTFVTEVTEILGRVGLDPRLLQIELTESVMLRGAHKAAGVMKELRALGIGIAIDDFGTGYSCLSYLSRLPFNSLKIDRSFVKELDLRPETKAMVQSLISLAHNLNMQVIVEGIETPQQLEIVKDMGGNEVQGFFLGIPTADPQLEIRLRQNSKDCVHRDDSTAMLLKG
jgi:diguanylate cyclase (GGDEF)-like protein